MGIYLNPGTTSFREDLNSQIFVDKSGLIALTNAALCTNRKYMCISRPRRFGKTMAMNMLAAYYSRGSDSRALFEGLAICADESYAAHIGKYDVLKLNMQDFLSREKDIGAMLDRLTSHLLRDLLEEYDRLRYHDREDLVLVMQDIYAQTGRPFVILIDEWDCIFRSYDKDLGSQEAYLDYLRMWLKDRDFVGLAYMTGILPVKKYGTHSALNMFMEYSMTDPGGLARYFGFTESEVRTLCAAHRMSFEEARAWYDGYELSEATGDGEVTYSIYNPKSVVESMLRHKYGTYWNQTETYEALRIYIELNMDGLKDAIVRMLTGDRVRIDTGGFENDMVTFATKDDVLTLLVHLGYLSYRERDASVSVPNMEVTQVYISSIKRINDWREVARSIDASRRLLEALWAMDADAVAAGIDLAHDEVALLQYNNENALSCTIGLAFYCAREYYTIVRELPTGKGFADVCFLPRPKCADKPAVIIELKWDRSARGAIAQIRDRQYVAALRAYRGNLLLVGINYDRESKKHTCSIERTELCGV